MRILLVTKLTSNKPPLTVAYDANWIMWTSTLVNNNVKWRWRGLFVLFVIPLYYRYMNYKCELSIRICQCLSCYSDILCHKLSLNEYLCQTCFTDRDTLLVHDSCKWPPKPSIHKTLIRSTPAITLSFSTLQGLIQSRFSWGPPTAYQSLTFWVVP